MIRALGLALATVSPVALVAPACAQETSQNESSFDIEAGALANALDQLAEQSGLQIIYRSDRLANTQTAGVSGTMTADAALSALLNGTGFEARQDSSGAYAIVKAGNISAGQTSSNNGQILVTGSRIQNPNLTSTNPITSLTGDQLRVRGNLNLAEAVQRIPALINTEQLDSFDEGRQNLNLRNLGIDRTLTLVDGKRFVGGSSINPAVDIGNIPIALIERVDVLTGGASSIYGADAVAGVVNFILKDDFEGVEVSGQAGLAAGQGDAEEYQFSIVAGTNFDNGRGNVTASYTYNRSEAFLAEDRSFASSEFAPLVDNPSGGLPAQIHFPGARTSGFPADGSALTLFGVLDLPFPPFLAPLPLGDFNSDGTPFNDDPIIGDGALQSEISFPQLRPDTRRHILSLSANYELSPAAKPYVDVHFTDAELVRQTGNHFAFGEIASTNAFLTAPLPPLFPGFPIFILRSQPDLALPRTQDDRTFRIVAGIEGQLSDSLRYDIYVNHGRNDSEETRVERLEDRFQAALDAVVDPATGDIVCASNLAPQAFFFPAPELSFTPGASSGCVPFDLFTSDLGANAASLDFLFTEFVNQVDTEQTVISGYLAGEIPLFSVAPAEFVLGAEYRDERAARVIDTRATTAAGLAQFPVDDQIGGFDVFDVFGELAIPIIESAPGADELSVRGAFRYSDYSLSGSEFTYNFGAVWAPTPDFKFRGSYARAVRAPNLGELFRPAFGGPNPFIDPCDTTGPSPAVNNGSGSRATNCATDLAAVGVADPSTYAAGFVFTTQSFSGNINLEPEVADTLTIGLVAQPSFAPGLSFTIDYYDISIENAIESPSGQFIIDQCYDSPDLNNQFCDLVTRSSTPAMFPMQPGLGNVSAVSVIDLNLARFDTSGIEFNLNYQTSPGAFGQWAFNLAGHYLITDATQPTPDAASRIDTRGIETNEGNASGKTPTWILNADANWNLAEWDANLGVSFHNSVLRGENVNRATIRDLTDDPFLDPLWDVRLQAGYSFGDRARIFVGMNNVLDQKPDLGTVFAPIGPVGRFVYAGANFKIF